MIPESELASEAKGQNEPSSASKRSSKPISAMIMQDNEQQSQIHMGTVGNQGDAASQQVQQDVVKSKQHSVLN